ncbi:hypothetical protein [Enterococcus sp. AZ103]|uniref:hypothetical protein n=1 Tax=Enterococcus sp. AZ103 TaxID=2774628 RepID=UPI003F215CB7
MNYKERKDYLFYVSIAFLVGSFLYGCLAFFPFVDSSLDLPMKTKIINFILSTLLGGYLICSILSGILQFIRFIKKQSRLVKILSIVFFLITILIIIAVGFFSTLPYYIYNIWQVKKRKILIEK